MNHLCIESQPERGGGVSEELDRARIFTAVFEVLLRFCSEPVLTFNKNGCNFSYTLLCLEYNPPSCH